VVRRSQSGMTLIEVLVAMAILVTTIVLLLERAASIMEKSGEAIAKRKAWPLLSRKMAELELDPAVFAEPQTSGSGGGESGSSSADRTRGVAACLRAAAAAHRAKAKSAMGSMEQPNAQHASEDSGCGVECICPPAQTPTRRTSTATITSAATRWNGPNIATKG